MNLPVRRTSSPSHGATRRTGSPSYKLRMVSSILPLALQAPSVNSWTEGREDVSVVIEVFSFEKGGQALNSAEHLSGHFGN